MVVLYLYCGTAVQIDDADVELVNNHRWHFNGGYARTNIKQVDGSYKGLYMHNLILGFIGIDHIDGNGLNNTKANLRAATKAENSRNNHGKRGKYGKGVYKNKNRYTVKIGYENKRLYVGHYETIEEAKKAYDEAALKFHGEFAALNYPNTGYEKW